MARQTKHVLVIKTVIIPEMVNYKSLRQKISNAEIEDQHDITGTKVSIAGYALERLKSMIPTKKTTDLMTASYDEKTNQMKLKYDDPRPILDFLSVFPFFTKPKFSDGK